MRRFFSRSRQNKEQQQQQQQQQPIDFKTKNGNDKGTTGSSSSLEQPSNAAVAASASPNKAIAGAGDNSADNASRPPVTPSKQVAFAVKTLPATPEASPSHQSQYSNDDVHSHASYHGGSPARGAQRPSLGGCFAMPSTTTSTARSVSNPGTPNHQLLSIPSQPTRHASLDVSSPTSPTTHNKDRDATLRATQMQTSSPTARGEIPRFHGGTPTTPTSPAGTQQQQRSTTSMSQNTSISTSSSMLEARQAFYGSNNNGSGDRAYYPNLAILATYSRDMSSLYSRNAPSAGQQQNTSIMQHLTWSEITDEQLVENLGGRERTRQEVLFEMVCSEERYVQELMVSIILSSAEFSYAGVPAELPGSYFAGSEGELLTTTTREALAFGGSIPFRTIFR